jgi:transposase
VEWLEEQVVTLKQESERRVLPFEEQIRRLVTIPGIERKTAWSIVSETGVEMNAFPTPGILPAGLSSVPAIEKAAASG